MQNKEIKMELKKVSICTTFKNAGRYIERFIVSGLNQTYKDIEVVLVDENSTDQSEKIIRAFEDKRIKYLRLDKDIGIAECLKKAFELADGEYAVFPGADDFLANNFVERGIKAFREHPEAAGIVPKITTLNSDLSFNNNMNWPDGIYSKEWFAKRLYRSNIGVASQMALVRRKDALDFMKFFISSYCNNQDYSGDYHPQLEELKRMYARLFGTDMLYFLWILRHYKHFVWDNSLIFYKTIQPDNMQFASLGKANSILGILKYYNQLITTYFVLYAGFYPKYLKKMVAWLGREALSSLITLWIKGEIKASGGIRKEWRESLKQINPFLRIRVLFFLPLRLMRRFGNWNPSSGVYVFFGLVFVFSFASLMILTTGDHTLTQLYK